MILETHEYERNINNDHVDVILLSAINVRGDANSVIRYTSVYFHFHINILTKLSSGMQ